MSRKAFSIMSGLASGQVFQRGTNAKAKLCIKGSSAHEGTVEGRVLKGKETVVDWKQLAVRKGKAEAWEGELAGVPTGGPYTVALRVTNASGRAVGGEEVKGVWVGDLWVLAGQSNMQGVGLLDSDELEKPSRLVRSYSMAEQWERAEEPLHWLLDSPDSCHWECKPAQRAKMAAQARRTRIAGAGLGLTFGKEIVKRAGIPVGLIPCAHGGTSMAQWSPELKDKGGKSLYGSMLRRIEAVGGEVKGVLWYQGESDANDKCLIFEKKFEAFIRSLRADLGAPQLPFYFAQLGCYVGPGADSSAWNTVREMQRKCAEKMSQGGMVAAVDLPLDDLIHISTDGLKRLGKRMADLACRDLYGEKTLKGGPRLARISYVNKERTQLRLEYEGINGGLVSPRRVGGFSFHDQEGYFKAILFDARIDPKRRESVLLRLTRKPPSGSVLYYAGGLNPYCTLADERDHAAPAFGPLELDGVKFGKG